MPTPSKPAQILIIDDEADLRNALRDELESENFRILAAATANEGLKQALLGPDVIILDLRLPDQDGYDVCRKLKSNPLTASIPVIMLSTRSRESEKVIGLELGADDYVSKPYSSQELLARIRVVLRRKEAAPPPPAASLGEPAPAGILSSGGVSLDHDGRKVKVDGAGVKLTKKEFDLLALFMSQPGKVFKRAFIMESVWGYEVDSLQGTIDSHIKTLRRKLGAEGRRIETVTGVGYRWEDDGGEETGAGDL